MGADGRVYARSYYGQTFLIDPDPGVTRLEHIAPGQIDCRSALERKGNVRLVRRDQCVHHAHDVATGEVVRFEVVEGNVQSRLYGTDARVDHRPGRHSSQSHAHERRQPDVCARGPRCDPEIERHQIQHDGQRDDYEDQQSNAAANELRHVQIPLSVIGVAAPRSGFHPLG